MSEIERKALQLIAQAEKKKSNGFFSFIFRNSSRQEEAAELYVRAANTFKRAKKWNEAGRAFVEAARLTHHPDSRHEAATHYIEAAVCFRKTDIQEAINHYLKAIDIYTDMGRFVVAAKHHVSIAEICETELGDIQQAMTNYETAADYYKGEQSTSSASRCLTNVAKYAAQLEDYQKAIEIYEEIGTAALTIPLLKYSAKDHLFKAALCHMCIDSINAQIAVKKYEEISPTFTDSRECKLLKELLTALEEDDIDAFTAAVTKYDSISRLDPWYTSILLRIKKSLSEVPDLM